MQKALAETTAAEAATKEQTLRLYGWMDMGMTRLWGQPGDLPSVLPAAQAASFAVGNINLYFDFQPTEHWSSMLELRFTNQPDGDVSFNQLTPVSTSYVDSGAPIPWSFTKLGGVVLERAYIQYRHNDLLQLRLGQFLTPFGIWNVDHGAPTLIAMALPVFMVQLLFPRTLIGIEALGNTQVGNWDLGYVAHVSNGRTLYQHDPTNDKAFGGRIYGRTSRPYRIQLGASAYWGRYSEVTTTLKFVPQVSFSSMEVTAFDELDLGLDLSLDAGPLRFRTELSRGQYVYETGKRPPDVLGAPGAKTADSVQLDWYGLLAYRLPVWGLEPYLYFEYYKWPSGAGDGYVAPSAGLNIYVTPSAQLRFQYIEHYFYSDLSNWTRLHDRDKKIAIFRLVLGF